MQKLLEDRLTSLNTEVKYQLNEIAFKTNVLENRSMLSDLELNHLQKKINKLQTRKNQTSPNVQAFAKSTIPRVSSARRRQETDRDLSVWEIGVMDYRELLDQVDSKSVTFQVFTRLSQVSRFQPGAAKSMIAGFHEASMYCFPSGKLLSPDQLLEHQVCDRVISVRLLLIKFSFCLLRILKREIMIHWMSLLTVNCQQLHMMHKEKTQV